MPLRYKGKNYIYLRALEVIHYFETVALDVELVISDSSEMKLLHNEYNKVKIIKVPFDSNVYSPAKARNDGIKICSKKYVFFFRC